ncbi:type VII secretion protein EccCa [Mycobacterium sp. 852014-52144_SCH5372336]|uniref:type VII secretion protein EccCa n=1 Tax=Mycobacterium sp. 852014-52144_SCH5372336 TaxID=1834115 RepID=UPI0007FE1962|nr:type VII secretion protein EccCa [Mycobacterium sp. 852014-52144_SCH5372336]OBB77489.1 type VII secretion protein EccC [Mycobacterium sp. 852014-52144_SCH5372336]
MNSSAKTLGVVVKSPPALPKAPSTNPVARLLPLAMLVAAVGMMAVYFTSGASANRTPMFAFFPVMMVMSVLGTMLYGARGGADRSAEIDRNRRSYLRYLDGLDDEVVAAAVEQRRQQYSRHPAPESLWASAGNRRTVRADRDDDDFCCVRVGVGAQTLCTPLVEPDLGALDDRDPVTVSAVRTLIRQRSVVPRSPATVALRQHGVIAVCGDDDSARGLVRAMVCQLATHHDPRQVAITAVTDHETCQDWEWLKWLPHHEHSSRTRGGPTGRHLVVVAEGSRTGEVLTETSGVTVLAIGADPVESVACLRVDGEHLTVRIGDRRETVCEPDSLTLTQATMCARQLAAHGSDAAPAGGTHRMSAVRGWLDLMGIDQPNRLTPEKVWSQTRQVRPVPIGVADDGTPVLIDINEAARNGIGPHGLCVGATGSGKSELLRTLVLGMITTHPPEVLNFILVDFKGGATFLGVERSRHVAAVITNLAREAHLVARMSDALAGEIHRRQELLRAAGNFVNIADYARARSNDARLPPLPALFIVVDEFSELLAQHPDFAELFVAIGRLGRSLGIHLLLASQRLDEGRLRGLDTHLSYRICLKTFSAGESRAVLGVPDAHTLPGRPGAALLKTAAGDLIRFQTAFVSGPCPRPNAEDGGDIAVPMIFTATPPTDHDEHAEHAPALLDAVLDRAADRGTAAHRVWLEPLAAPPTLDLIMSTAAKDSLSVPMGLVDSPFDQRRDLLVAQMAAGNVAIVGAPQSGKSTALQTLVLALAEAHSPEDISLYIIDFGGGALMRLADLPHVGAVSGRADTDLCRRTVAVIESLIRSREKVFRTMGIGSMAEYRTRRAAQDPAAAGDPHGDVFLVVDGWAHLRRELEQLETPITAIAGQGLAFGVHVVITASRWPELRPALKDQIATRIELRLGDPAESEMDRRRARALTNCPPGRGITADGCEMMIALPRFDGVPSTEGLGEALAATVGRHRQRWRGCLAPRIQLLPVLVRHPELVARCVQPAETMVLGLDEHELAPVTVDFAEQMNMLVLGEGGCGKTSLLRVVCQEIVRTHRVDQVRLEIVDFRRSLLGVVETEHLAGYAASPVALAARVPKLLGMLEARMPGEDVTQRQLRDRSWWSGPEIFLVVDDYDLVAGSTGNPLTPLADFLPHAADLGLHVIVARRSGGAARAMFDPLLARMREIGCLGVMMSASADDGVLMGSVRPSSLPPGRATLITRGEGERLIQVGWAETP